MHLIFQWCKVIKKSQNSRNQVFSYFFCLTTEGAGSGSVPLNNGSGSGRPKNLWIRIRNTFPNIINHRQNVYFVVRWKKCISRISALKHVRTRIYTVTDPLQNSLTQLQWSAVAHAELDIDGFWLFQSVLRIRIVPYLKEVGFRFRIRGILSKAHRHSNKKKVSLKKKILCHKICLDSTGLINWSPGSWSIP